MLAWDREEPGRFRFAALQSDAGRALLRRSGRSPDDISSIVLVREEAGEGGWQRGRGQAGQHQVWPSSLQAF